ncbi:unnamed protein product [Moneuplotes crassus]|uniref:EamA domain-containing protein n=1 Tax=Euplotes crassus TaxID=5936 RepID=A0AAD2CWE7_EUPCR|nr:unnamed protein product [Moneuplotes crassus]
MRLVESLKHEISIHSHTSHLEVLALEASVVQCAEINGEPNGLNLSSEECNSEQFLTHEPHKGINMKGVIYGILMNFIWSFFPLCLGLLYKYTPIDEYEAAYWKSMFMNIANILLANYYHRIIQKKKGEPEADIISIPKECRSVLLCRALFGSISLCCLFASMKYTSISKSNILFFTGPLYVPFLSYFFLKEGISKIDILALVMGFSGILLINSPKDGPQEGSNDLLGGIFAAVGGLTASFAWVSIRKMGSKVHFTVPCFYFSLGTTVTSIIFYLYNIQGTPHSAKYDWYSIMLIMFASFFQFAGQILQSLAYQHEKASRIAVFYYFQTALVFMYDYFFFSITFGSLEIIGAVLIISCNFTIALLKFFGFLEG